MSTELKASEWQMLHFSLFEERGVQEEEEMVELVVDCFLEEAGVVGS